MSEFEFGFDIDAAQKKADEEYMKRQRANVQDKNGFMPYNFDPSNDLGMVINLK